MLQAVAEMVGAGWPGFRSQHGVWHDPYQVSDGMARREHAGAKGITLFTAVPASLFFFFFQILGLVSLGLHLLSAVCITPCIYLSWTLTLQSTCLSVFSPCLCSTCSLTVGASICPLPYPFPSPSLTCLLGAAPHATGLCSCLTTGCGCVSACRPTPLLPHGMAQRQ